MSSNEQLWPVLFAVASRMLGNESEAEDIVQESLHRLPGAGINALQRSQRPRD